MKKQCGVLAAVRTDIGKVRTENQDRILSFPACRILCGGMMEWEAFCMGLYRRISS